MDDLASRTAYDPKPVEERWSRYWVESGIYRAPFDERRPVYAIVIPPPNVTGVLHIGHALDNTIQDILIRFARMRGKDTLWLPGTDHAGIATQVVVARQLGDEGINPRDIGRDAFVERVWEWKRESHKTITAQLQRLGCSLDWSRERFTLDEQLSRAVREAFCLLYDQGLIYRGRRIVNWCPNDQTALSDEEVIHEEHQGKLWHIRYPLDDGSGHVEVATTRPETMLGDTGVAVHPDDPRYAALVGRTVTLPLMERPIPIVADERVDPAFGTGAVKVTPAHDPLDFEIGAAHDLAQVVVIGLDGTMTNEAGQYAGLSREECRDRVLEDLCARGLLGRVDEHTHSIGHCQRCETIVEPLVSRQWFLHMPPLARRAIEATRNGEGPVWAPGRWEKVYLDWLERLGDWCISRQLWWGHRIPVWTCAACGREAAFKEDPAACPQCGSADLTQDEDVLDTWFSSGLWPFSTMGWPDESAPDYRRYFPTSVLVTGYDIIFFWVVRMVTMSLHLTGRVPFHTVYIHGLVRDEHGRKISKSLGNAVDPIEVMDEYGTDALRYALTSLVTGGQDLSFGPSRLVGARNFCNKIFNASRLVLMNLDGAATDDAVPPATDLRFEERWIVSRAARAIHSVTQALERMELSDAAEAAYRFWWAEFCDWYVEMAKPFLYGEDADARRRTQAILRTVLGIGLRLLHPIMPYITEELWHALPGTAGCIGLADWPEARTDWLDPLVEERMDAFQEIARAVRNLKAEKGVAASASVRVALRPSGPIARQALADGRRLLAFLARVESLDVLDDDAPRPHGTVTAVAADGTEVFLFAEGVLDLDRERARLAREIEGTEQHLERVRRKLANADFVSKAPAEVVEGERAREAELMETLARLDAAREDLG